MKDSNSTSLKFIFAGMLAFLASIPGIISGQNVMNEAPEHFNKFNTVNGGWCAADATISLLLPDGKTLWLFGDTFIGEKNGEFGIKPSKSRMINNCAILEDGNILTAHYGGTFANPSSFIPGVGQDFFWPEHAIVENDTLKVFALRIKYKDNGTPGFNFQVGTTYKASYKYPDLEHIETVEFKSVTDTAMRFGACVIKSGDHTYIFGVKDTTSEGLTYPLPYLARVSRTIEEPWQFYAGSDTWSYDCNDARPVGDRPMSESFYVYEKNGKFYLIMHEIWLVGELFILEADNVTGPWNRSVSGGIENRFAVVKPHTGNISYNLFAHPQFQNDGKILISFNVNTTSFNSIYQDSRNYRARFYWLDVEAAVTATIPDTAKLFDTPVGINQIYDDNHPNKLSFHPFTKSLQISGINSPASLSIYDTDGRLYLKRKIYDDTEIDCNQLPGKLIIIRLEDQWGVETKKIILI